MVPPSYVFTDLDDGLYMVRVGSSTVPFSPANEGTNDWIDSDVDAAGESGWINILDPGASGGVDSSAVWVDAGFDESESGGSGGMYMPRAGGDWPDEPEGEAPGSTVIAEKGANLLGAVGGWLAGGGNVTQAPPVVAAKRFVALVSSYTPPLTDRGGRLDDDTDLIFQRDGDLRDRLDD